MAQAPRQTETPDARVARLADELAIDPPFVERPVNNAIHGDYLEAAHEMVTRTLAVIHMRLAQGDIEGATDLTAKTRAKLDSLWEGRKEAAVRGVRP